MQTLAEYNGIHEDFFVQLHFQLWEEPTTNSVRNVRWLHRFPAFDLPETNNPEETTTSFQLVLSVDYELVIGDAPEVSPSANFDYCFNGVRLELWNSRTDEPLGTLPLKITTASELKAFLSTFRSHPYSRNTSCHAPAD
jgi:hypothetical protein